MIYRLVFFTFLTIPLTYSSESFQIQIHDQKFAAVGDLKSYTVFSESCTNNNCKLIEIAKSKNRKREYDGNGNPLNHFCYECGGSVKTGIHTKEGKESTISLCILNNDFVDIGSLYNLK